MADFIYLFKGGEGDQSPAQMQAHMQKWVAWMKELGEKGHFKSGEPLEAKGKVVSGRSKVVTDGVFAESKDVVGGYLLISAENLDHAVELSKKCPILERNGVVEVRPVMIMKM